MSSLSFTRGFTLVQTRGDLKDNVSFLGGLGARRVSCYLLAVCVAMRGKRIIFPYARLRRLLCYDKSSP
eukprot:8387465-Pyramimonas_sp.AAC.2